MISNLQLNGKIGDEKLSILGTHTGSKKYWHNVEISIIRAKSKSDSRKKIIIKEPVSNWAEISQIMFKGIYFIELQNLEDQ